MSRTSQVLLTDSDFGDCELERSALAEAGLELVTTEGRWTEALPGIAANAEGILVQWVPVDEDLLGALRSLRVVGRFGVGVDTIDLEAASRRGIAVVHSGNYATEEVALHTVSLALAAFRRLLPGDRAVRSGRWTDDGYFRGIRRLSGLQAGVVGLGRIGARVAAHLGALGMRVVGYDPQARPPEVPQAASLDQLLTESDLVTLHVPLTPATSGLIDSRRLSLMPPGSVLVNAARGGLVDEDALVRELEAGRLAGAALDVFRNEPLPRDHPLCQRDDVLLSPHVGYYSEQALIEARSRTVEGVISVLRGERPRDIANPEVLSQ